MNNVRPSEIVVMASGAVLLLFSFLDWYGEGGFAESAWDAFPLLTWPALLGAAAAALAAVRAFGNVDLPRDVLTFTWPQLYVMAGVVSVLITVGWWIASEVDGRLGLFVSILGAIGLLVGGIMMLMEGDRSAGAGGSSTI